MLVTKFKTFCRGLHWFENAVLVTALAAMLGFALLQIGLRNFFDSGLLWAESFLNILVLWVAMLGAMVATREQNHINIDTLSHYLPRRLKMFFGVLTALFAAAICATVAWYSVEFIQYEYEDKTIAFGIVPTWVCQSIIPFGFAVMALRFLGAVGLIITGRHQW